MIWPFAVATEAGRCLLTFLVVIPGHVVNWLFVIDLSHIEGHGLKQHWFIYLFNVGSCIEVCTLFAVAAGGVYCGRSSVNFVFKGINYSEVSRSRGSNKISFFVVKI